MNLLTLIAVFQALVHLPLVWTFLMGSDCPREISVDSTRPMFSLGADTWCSEESTASRLTAWPRMMLSHSKLGKPRGAVLDVLIHCLMAL